MTDRGLFVKHLWDIFKTAYTNDTKEIYKASLMFLCNCLAGSCQFKGAPELDWENLCDGVDDTALTEIYRNDLLIIEKIRTNEEFYKTITELFELGRRDQFDAAVKNFVA